jgi:pyruvate,water dikinase
MMTDAIKPLGMSFFEMISQFSLGKSGGRLFENITHDMAFLA